MSDEITSEEIVPRGIFLEKIRRKSMSKVYKCDRCGDECTIRERDETKVFSEVIYTRCLYGDKGNTIHLCPHCMKKLEEFLSDPNCMEEVDPEKDKSEDEETYCTECEHFEDIKGLPNDWFGARCKLDGHETSPSMYAISSLHNGCPLKKKEEEK